MYILSQGIEIMFKMFFYYSPFTISPNTIYSIEKLTFRGNLTDVSFT